MNSQKEKPSSTKCRRIWSWLSMFILWGCIAFLAISISYGLETEFLIAITLLIFSYIGYLITACCSPTGRYLFNKHKAQSIHSHMEKIFSTAPEIEWHVECYHYVTRFRTTYLNGKRTTKSYRDKKVTHRQTKSFQFYSWRDISGLFVLDSHKIFRTNKKTYIKLELINNIELADDITRYDYQREKDNFYNLNKSRDTHIRFWESRTISGYNQYNLVRISNYNPPFVNGFWYVFFTIIPFIEFYKIYVNQFCIEQDYTVQKIISTRYNLNLPEHSQRYENLKPGLAIFDQPTKIFENSPQLIHNEPVLPSLEELDEAKRFTNINGCNRNAPSAVLSESYVPHFKMDDLQKNLNSNPGNDKLNGNSYLNVSTDGFMQNNNQGYCSGQGINDCDLDKDSKKSTSYNSAIELNNIGYSSAQAYPNHQFDLTNGVSNNAYASIVIENNNPTNANTQPINNQNYILNDNHIQNFNSFPSNISKEKENNKELKEKLI